MGINNPILILFVLLAKIIAMTEEVALNVKMTLDRTLFPAWNHPAELSTDVVEKIVVGR